MNVHTAIAAMLMILLLLPLVEAGDTLLITQVLYNPTGSESGGEAVELYNPTDTAINLSGWALATETSDTDVVFPASAIIKAEGYFLVTDSGWGETRDDLGWPGSDHEETLTLNNMNSGVGLVFNSTIIDAVGWGDALGIEAGLFEGTPTILIDEGMSLRRLRDSGNYTDTDNNSADFTGVTPVWHNSSMRGISSFGSWIVQLAVTILNSAPSVTRITLLTDDFDEEGIQLAPRPKELSTLEILAEVYDPNGVDDLKTVSANAAGVSAQLSLNATLNETHALYNGTLEFPHYIAPGSYAVRVTGEDYGNQSAENFGQFEYMELLALELDTTTLALQTLSGELSQATGDESMDTPMKPTLRNTGNIPLNLRISATDLVGEEATIPADAIGYGAGNLTGKLTNGEALLTIGLEPGPLAVMPLNLTLETNQTYPAGVYLGTIEFSPVR